MATATSRFTQCARYQCEVSLNTALRLLNAPAAVVTERMARCWRAGPGAIITRRAAAALTEDSAAVVVRAAARLTLAADISKDDGGWGCCTEVESADRHVDRQGVLTS